MMNNCVSVRTISELQCEAKALANELRQLQVYPEIATEGLGSGIKTLLMRLADVAGGLVFTSISNITSLLKAVKRTEMRHRWDSFRVTFSSIESRLNNPHIGEVMMSIPSGLKVSFPDAIATIRSGYEILDTKMLLDGMNSALTKIKTSLMASEFSQINWAVITEATRALEVLVNKFSGFAVVYAKHANNFSRNDKTLYVDFTHAYVLPSQFVATRTNLLEMEDYLLRVPNIVTQVKANNLILTDIIARLGDFTEEALNDKVSLLETLAKQIYTLAGLFEGYSSLAIAQTSLEHNHLLNYGILDAKLKELAKLAEYSKQQ